MTPIDPKALEAACEASHDAYETAAAHNGWDTNPLSRKPWQDVPEANKATVRVGIAAALRSYLEALPAPVTGETGEAADLEAAAEQALRALGPFATAAAVIEADNLPDGLIVHAAKSATGEYMYVLTVADFRRARALTRPAGERGETKPDTDGWIEWKGGECPVDPEAMVLVRCQGDTKPFLWSEAPKAANTFAWNVPAGHGPRYEHRIIAYRLATPEGGGNT